MDMIKKFFPFSFGVRDVIDLVIKIVIYLVVGLVISLICRVIGIIPVIGPIIGWLVGSVVDLYALVGIVLSVLDFLKVIK